MIIRFFAALAFVLLSLSLDAANQSKPVLLFDGKTFNGWAHKPIWRLIWLLFNPSAQAKSPGHAAPVLAAPGSADTGLPVVCVLPR